MKFKVLNEDYYMYPYENKLYAIYTNYDESDTNKISRLFKKYLKLSEPEDKIKLDIKRIPDSFYKRHSKNIHLLNDNNRAMRKSTNDFVFDNFKENNLLAENEKVYVHHLSGNEANKNLQDLFIMKYSNSDEQLSCSGVHFLIHGTGYNKNERKSGSIPFYLFENGNWVQHTFTYDFR